MTDRERLIELIIQANEVCSNKDCAECEYLNNDRILCDTYNIADYLLANGVIVPPCKVGDMVYEIQPIRQRVQSYEITTLKWNSHYWWFTWILKDRKGIYGNVEGFSSHQFGKTVFLTKEEAEAKLRELKK